MAEETPRALEWLSDTEFRLSGTEFDARDFHGFVSTVDRFFLMKPRALVEEYVDLVQHTKPRNIFELGIFRGGSTAFLSHLATPERLVAIELDGEPVVALQHFIERFGYGESVRTHYGIDQSDHRVVDDIYRREFGDVQLDLVLDDASHELDSTRASFNTLFPRLRSGGLYIIEDWSWGLFAFAGTSERRLLAPLVVELLCSLPYYEGMIQRVMVDKYWAVVERGTAPLPAGTFDLANCYGDRARAMIVDA